MVHLSISATVSLAEGTSITVLVEVAMVGEDCTVDTGSMMLLISSMMVDCFLVFLPFLLMLFASFFFTTYILREDLQNCAPM